MVVSNFRRGRLGGRWVGRQVALAVHEREDTLQLRAKLVKVKPQREQCQLPDCRCGGPSKRQPLRPSPSY